MAVRIFDVSELATNNGLSLPLMEGETFRIRLRFSEDINLTKRKQAIDCLKNIGYRQVGNTLSWILDPQHNERILAGE